MRPIAGKPLIDHTFDAAKAASTLTTVCLTSEDPDILAHAKQAGLETVTRDPEMSGDAVHASVPIIAALVDLEEGTRIVSNIVDCRPEDVHVGMPVQGSIEEGEDGMKLPVFRRAG